MDPASGRVYYFHTITKESVWELPASAQTPPELQRAVRTIIQHMDEKHSQTQGVVHAEAAELKAGQEEQLAATEKAAGVLAEATSRETKNVLAAIFKTAKERTGT